MRFAALLVAASVVVTGVVASILALNVDTANLLDVDLSARAENHNLLDVDLSAENLNLLDVDLSAENHYGAPIPPWVAGHKPGWYFGSHPNPDPELPRLDQITCKILNVLPSNWLHCPTTPPPTPVNTNDSYTQAFSHLTGATQAADYLTYGLVDTVADCKAMCDSINDCKFVNTYHDVHGKDGSVQLTCSLFLLCHDSSDADNRGGQREPDGSFDYIADSEGWCKE